MNRFGKDIDTLDNLLGDALRMFANTMSNILGAIILISILLPWFLIAVGGISFLYYFYAVFYRSSARELKVRSSRSSCCLRSDNARSAWTPSCGPRSTRTSPSRSLAWPPSEHTVRSNASRRTTRSG
jgi:hypothetical protein